LFEIIRKIIREEPNLIALGHKSRALYMWISVHFILLAAPRVAQQQNNSNIDVVEKDTSAQLYVV